MSRQPECRTWSVTWNAVPDALAYELLVQSPASGINGAELLIRDTACTFDLPSADQPRVKVRPVLVRDGESLTGTTAAANAWSKVTSLEPLDGDNAASHVDLDTWTSFDGRRLGLARFNVSTDTVVRTLDKTLDLTWTPPAQADFVEICLRTDPKVEDKIVRRWVRTAGAEALDLSDLPPGEHTVTVRCGFPSRKRYGPRTNVVRLAVGDDAERRSWEDDRDVNAARTERLTQAVARARTVAENVEVLLEDLAARRTELRAVPINASLALGYDCNADCLQCDEGRVRRPHRIPESLVRDVVDIAIPGGLASCELVGGEPLLYAETDRVAEVIETSAAECEVRLRTNGMLLDERWARRVAAGRYAIIVSLDGASATTFNAIRRKLDFERVLGNMRRISKLAADNPHWDGFGVYYVVMKQNAHEVVDLVRLAAESDIRSVHLGIVENPQDLEELRELDPLADRQGAATLLRDLYESRRLAAELGVSWMGRAIQRILCEYPSLVQSPEETRCLPRDLRLLREDRNRPDMSVRETVTDSEIERLEQLRLADVGSAKESNSPFDRELTNILPRFESSSSEGIRLLRGMARGEARLCEYPFTELFLDTYRTYVCCQATTEYLYGHPFVGAAPRLAEIWNGNFLQSAREAMYRQKFDDVCLPHCEYYAGGGTYESIQRVLAGERRVRSQVRTDDSNEGTFLV